MIFNVFKRGIELSVNLHWYKKQIFIHKSYPLRTIERSDQCFTYKGTSYKSESFVESCSAARVQGRVGLDWVGWATATSFFFSAAAAKVKRRNLFDGENVSKFKNRVLRAAERRRIKEWKTKSNFLSKILDNNPRYKLNGVVSSCCSCICSFCRWCCCCCGGGGVNVLDGTYLETLSFVVSVE